MALESTGLLTQDAEPGSTTLIDVRNVFNELSHLAMLWTVHNRFPVGARFKFNCYRHWAQLLLHHPDDAPVIILIREGVTQGGPLLMVLYGINLAPLDMELMDADPTILPPLYTNDAACGRWMGMIWTRGK